MRENVLPENNLGLNYDGGLLKHELEKNGLLLEQLNKDQSAKMAELNKVKEELEELTLLYPGIKAKK